MIVPLRIVAAALFAAVLWTVPALAAGFENIIISTEEGAEETLDTVPADAPFIHVSATITDEVSSGTKLTVAWIAVVRPISPHAGEKAISAFSERACPRAKC